MSNRINSEQEWLPLAKEANWSVEKLAVNCGVSSRTLERHFKETMGKTPKAWLSEQRHKQAMKLLRDGLLVKETSSQVGYQHPNNFAREFKKLAGKCRNTLATTPLIKRQQPENVAY